MSSSAPFATTGSATSSDEQKGGRRKYEATSQRHDAPFATNYPEQRDEGNTPKKQVGRRRFDAQDAAHEAPFATGSEDMFQSPPASNSEPAVNSTPGEAGRQKAIKPTDNSDVFRYDANSAGETPSRGGRRRYQQEKQEAPFATFGGSDERNGTSSSSDTPRSAGGRRRFEDKLQKKPAPFAVDDGESDAASGSCASLPVSPPYANDY